MKKFILLVLTFFLYSNSYSQLALEGFEGATFPPTTPAPWAVFDNGVSATVNINWSTSGTAHTGVLAAFMNRQNIGIGNTSKDYLATPAVNIPANGQLKFYTRSFISGDQGTKYNIQIKPIAAGPQNDPAGYIQVQQWNENSLSTVYNVYEEKIVDLSAYSGQYYVAFMMEFTQPTASIGGDRWLVDDVQIVGQCFPPTNGVANPILSTSATLGWIATSGASSYEIENILATATPTGIATGTSITNSYPQSGLLANTNYTFYIRTICSIGNTSPWAGPFTYTTQVAPPVCGGNYVDEGGTTGNYSDSSNITTTICPDASNPTYKVTVTFTAFDTEFSTFNNLGYDGIYVYDGASATSPIISSGNPAGLGPLVDPGAYWGTTIPGPFTSTSPDGCLTFVFKSDSFGNRTGWISNITCGPPPTCALPKNLVATVINDISASFSWTQPANPDGSTATAWQYIALPCTAPAPTATSAWIPATTTTVTASGLTSDTCYNFYVQAICSPTDSSPIAGPKSATTLITPPACGGIFVDSGGATGNYQDNENITTVICPLIPTDKVTVTFTAFETETSFFSGNGIDGMYIYDGPNTASPQISSGNPGIQFGVLTDPGAYWGTTIPGPFTSTSADGCLTFIFKSDGFTNLAGWTANVTCGPPPTCALPKNLVATTINDTSATFSWTQPANPNGSTATAWQYIALPCTAPAPTATSAWIPATTTTVTASGLTSNTCYNFYVQAICSPTDSSPIAGPKSATTLITPPACGGIFVDTGGATGDYQNNENITTIICPLVAGDKVTVTFTAFETETSFNGTGYDGIYVYDGNNTGAPIISSGNPAGFGPLTIPGAYWGTTIPGPFTSTSADGCLTFVFKSDSFGTRPGWEANVTCAPPPTCAVPKNLVATTVNDVSATFSWTQPASPDGTTATAWQYIALPCTAPAPTATSAWIPTTSTTVTATGLNSDTCYSFYVQAICSPTDSSPFAGPKQTTTLITPPACGGVFVDSGGITGDYQNNENITTIICPAIAGQVVTITFTAFDTEAFGTFGNDGMYVYDGQNTSAPQIPSTNPAGFGVLTSPGAYFGTTIPGPFTSSSADGCLTFVFKSDSFGTRPGWEANVTCGPPPTCHKPNLLTNSNVTQTSVLLTWNQPQNPDNSVATQWQVLLLPAGAPSPTASSTGFLSASNNIFTVTGLTSATCYDYYVRAVCSATDSSLWAGPNSFCTLIQNDECSNATIVPVNADTSCAQIASGSLIGATASSQPSTCGSVPNDDVWFSFVATTSTHSIDLLNLNGGFGLSHAVYTGTNCNSLTLLYCSDFNTQSVASGLTIGQTYYIRVYSSFTPQNITFNVCVGTIPPPITTASTIGGLTPEQIVQNVLLNSTCASVTNVTYSTSTNFGFTESGIGTFNQNGSGFPFSNGVILSTGFVGAAAGPNTSNQSNGGGIGGIWPGDTDLEAIVLAATGQAMNSKNATKLEFDFIPITNQINFDFIFASEEYGTFQCNFSDAFAFLLTNISTGITTNLAVIPGTTTPISVVTVRNQLYNTACPSANETYFGQYNLLPGGNPLGSPTNFNGQTIPLTATAPVTIGASYHIKLVVADRQDTLYDSAVFLKGSSFGIGNLELGNNLLQANGTAVCAGGTKVINCGLDPAFYNFSWSNNGVVIAGQTGPSLTVTQAGTYTVNVNYINSNCSGSDSLIVEYYDPVIPATPNNLSICNVSGSAIFDLTQNTPVVTATLGTGYAVSYFKTSEDATLNTNVITLPSAYPNVTNPETIYVRVQNTATGCFGITSFTLTVNTVGVTPTFDPAPAVCYGASYSLPTTSINQINGTWSPDFNNTVTTVYTFNPSSSQCAVSTTLTVTITPLNTTTLSSATGTDLQTVCINTPLTSITYATTGATGVTATGLPLGVTANFASNVVTITGSPSVSGTFPYTITLTGGCGIITATGTITVILSNTIALSSVSGTDNQTICLTSAIVPIIYSTTGATNASVSGLPAGVIGSFASNTLTINGTPSVAGTFPYTVTLTGGCGTVTATGTITITPTNTILLSSAAGTDGQTVCLTNAIVPITYTTTGATNATVSGLPLGVTGSFASNILSITGTPSTIGIFPYTVTLTGGCGIITATGTITVNPINTIAINSGSGTDNQTLCISSTLTAITYTTSQATGATVTGLPSGILANFAANTVTINGIPTAAGTFTYTVTLTGGCGTVTATGIITVTPKTTATFAQIPSICQGLTAPSLPSGSSNTPQITGSWNPATISTVDAGSLVYTFTPDAGQCAMGTTMTVVVNPNPIFVIQAGCVGNVYTLEVIPVNNSFDVNTAQYAWTSASGPVGTSASTLAITTIGNYTCTVTNAESCSKTSVPYNAMDISCEVQRGISPNGDGLNDTFDLSALNVRELSIYNRYGLKVYSLTNYVNQWGGQTDGGKILPDGTYYYVIEKGDGDTKTGWIYINK